MREKDIPLGILEAWWPGILQVPSPTIVRTITAYLGTCCMHDEAWMLYW